LDLSRTLMYDFHYNFAKLMYSSNAMPMALFDGYWQFVMQNQGRGLYQNIHSHVNGGNFDIFNNRK